MCIYIYILVCICIFILIYTYIYTCYHSDWCKPTIAWLKQSCHAGFQSANCAVLDGLPPSDAQPKPSDETESPTGGVTLQ